ncbi:MAG: hypothetical protein K2P93_03610 [Alphaproteobacteria bacterium]|nr:hypothetical protein [Alphaproteobacteria bacterium]
MRNVPHQLLIFKVFLSFLFLLLTTELSSLQALSPLTAHTCEKNKIHEMQSCKLQPNDLEFFKCSEEATQRHNACIMAI